LVEGTVAAPQPLEGQVLGLAADDPRRHPRPSLTRPDWQSLDGEWEFGCGPPGGEPVLGGTIVVPFAPESPASGAAAPGPDQAVWYRRVLRLPAEWRGRRVFLRFNAADWETAVWVAGQRVAHHEGGYTPFGVDVTELVQDGPVELLVRCVDDPHDMSKPRGKQDWLPEPHSIWYPRTTGIWQTVWWEPLPAVRVERVAFTADLAAFALDMELRLAGVGSASGRPAGEGPARGGLVARVRLDLAGETLLDDSYAVSGHLLRRRLHLPDPGIDDARARFLWTPETPNLIDVTVTLERDGEVVDEARTRTALRTVETRDGALLLNGRPYRLRMALDQGYWEQTHLTPPDAGALGRDVALAKALGFNGVRKHQKLEDPRFYAWADHLGLLVWVELPSAYAFDAVAARRLTQTWLAAVEQASPHPSVMAWVPFNESWGVPDLPLSAPQRALVRGLADLTRALDPSRPVVGNDGWEMLGTDLVNVHDYTPDPDAIGARYATSEAIVRTLHEHRPGGRRLLLDGSLPGGRPVLLSEFGGVRVDDGAPGWGYDAVPDGAALLERYRRLAASVNGSALAGWCYTQLTDTFQERNGLLAMDRTPKADPAAIARATRGEPSPEDRPSASAGEGGDHPRAAEGRQEEDA
jgi:hypothetical protein